MSIASTLSRGKRVLVWCAATVLLHGAALGWVSGHIRPLVDRNARPPAPILAQLHLTLPEPAKAAPAPASRPLSAARPAPRPRPRPAPVLPEPVAEEGTLTAAPVPPERDEEEPQQGGAAAPSTAAEQTGARRHAATVESKPEPEAAAPVEVPEAVPAPKADEPRHYKVSLPPSAELIMDIARREANGTERSGSGAQIWQQDGQAYKVSVEVGISLLVTRLNLLVTNSEGGVDENGLAPATYSEKRLNRPLTATHFRREEHKISFSATENSYELQPGAQDFASLPFQLAAIGRGDPAQLAGTIDIQVADSRDASVYRFEVVGQETLHTGLGAVATVHLTRPPRPGSYSSRLDVWLAPERGWYPVQVRNTEGSGAVTTQSVNRIVISETGK